MISLESDLSVAYRVCCANDPKLSLAISVHTRRAWMWRAISEGKLHAANLILKTLSYHKGTK